MNENLLAGNVKTHIEHLEKNSSSIIDIKYDQINEILLLQFFRGIFKSGKDVFGRIVTLSIRNTIFSSYSASKFPKYLKFFKKLKYLSLNSKDYEKVYYESFVSSLHVAIFETGFERKINVSLELKSFYSCSLKDPIRENYILALIMTSFADARTFYSFDITSLYRFHFTFCEIVSRQRPDFKYLIGTSYMKIPKKHLSFFKNVKAKMGAFLC